MCVCVGARERERDREIEREIGREIGRGRERGRERERGGNGEGERDCACECEKDVRARRRGCVFVTQKNVRVSFARNLTQTYTANERPPISMCMRIATIER